MTLTTKFKSAICHMAEKESGAGGSARDYEVTVFEAVALSAEDIAAASSARRGETPDSASEMTGGAVSDSSLTAPTVTIVMLPSDLERDDITFVGPDWLIAYDGGHDEVGFDGTYESVQSLASCLSEFFGLSVDVVRHVDLELGMLPGAVEGLRIVDFLPGTTTPMGVDDLAEEVTDAGQ